MPSGHLIPDSVIFCFFFCNTIMTTENPYVATTLQERMTSGIRASKRMPLLSVTH